MFTNNIFSISNSDNNNNHYNKREESTHQKKAQQFHNHIRRTSIEEKKQQIRQQILKSLCEDYTVLKQINLTQCLASLNKLDCQQFSNEDQQLIGIIDNMFTYCNSLKSDHMYCLFNESTLIKLTNLIKIDKISNFEKNPKFFTKILWILASYAVYSNYFSQIFRDIMYQILYQICSIPNFYQMKAEFKIFTHVQTKQIMDIILMSFVNMIRLIEETERYFELKDEDNLYLLLIKEGRKISLCFQQIQIRDSYIEKILKKIYLIFQNLFGFQTSNPQIMKQIYRAQNQVIEIMLGHLQIFKVTSIELQTEIIVFLKRALLNDIRRYPQIVLNHNFTIIYPFFQSLTREIIDTNHKILNFHNLVQIQGEQLPNFTLLSNKSKSLQNRMIDFLQLFNTLFGLNIPEDKNEALYYNLYSDWLEHHLLPIFMQICKVKHQSFDKIKQKMLKILYDVCLEETFCESVLQDFTIMKNIFLYATTVDSNIKLRKSSLDCITGIIRVALDGQSDIRDTVLEICENNAMIRILANSIGQYVDETLNQNLLTALQMYLNSDVTEQSDKNRLWMQFCSEGGLVKLNHYRQCCNCHEINQLLQAIIRQYDKQ